MSTLKVRKFAQITDVTIDFGDLTVLVGPQATGKSLLLQFLKFGLDRPVIAYQLRKHGFSWPRGRHGLAATFLGEGYEKCFDTETVLSLGRKDVLETKGRSSGRDPRVFFIPAQRVVSVSNGWPRPFSDYGAGDPFVVKDFSQVVFESFGRGLGKEGAPIFPHSDRLKSPIRKSIENSIFHGGKLALKQEGPRTELRLRYPGKSFALSRPYPTTPGRIPEDDVVSLPFLEWSAGQREFTPLLLGLYQLLPAGKVSQHTSYRWAIIEEPEMGLHPMGITSVMLLVFELLYRGYKVALSTHAPYVLELIWAVQVLRRSKNPKKVQLFLQALGTSHSALKPVISDLLKKRIKVYALDYSVEGQHSCTDISSLDPSNANKVISGWGGVTLPSSLVSRAVAKGV